APESFRFVTLSTRPPRPPLEWRPYPSAVGKAFSSVPSFQPPVPVDPAAPAEPPVPLEPPEPSLAVHVACRLRLLTMNEQGSPKTSLVAATEQALCPRQAASTTESDSAAWHAPVTKVPHVPVGCP